jgi:hypothetical protein
MKVAQPVDAVAFQRIGLNDKKARRWAANNANVGVWPLFKVCFDLLGVGGRAPFAPAAEFRRFVAFL